MAVLFFILKMMIVVLIIILLILTAMMFIPFKYIAKGTINEGVCGNVSLKWLFGLIKFIILKEKESSKAKIQLSLCGINISGQGKKKSKTGKMSKRKKSEKKDKNSNKNQFSMKLLNIICNYIKEILNIIKPQYIKADGTYVFEDPSITGILCGIISIINTAFPNNSINLVPRFEEEVCDVKFEIMGKVFGFIIAFKTIRLLMKKEIRKIIFSKKEKNVKPLKPKMCIK